MKLALGTVQFGLPYGVANQTGQVSRSEIRQILAFARESGINTLDTAIAYGDSEARLGEVGTKGFKLVTKLPALPEGVTDVCRWVNDQVQDSLGRLQTDGVYGLLLHRSQQLKEDQGEALIKALQRLKEKGIVQKIGISIYAPSELETTIPACPIDLVQAPFNLLDRRLHTSGWLTKLHDAGVEVHARSVFLQGLLLLPMARIKRKFKPWDALWKHWHEWLQDTSVSATKACLQFPLSFAEIDQVVVGVDTRVQLEELVLAVRTPKIKSLPELTCEDERLINPANWELLET